MNEPEQLSDEAIEAMELGEDDIDLMKLDWSKRIPCPVKLKRGPKWVRRDDSVRLLFQGDEEVNEALRMLMRQGYPIDFERRFARQRAAASKRTASRKKA